MAADKSALVRWSVDGLFAWCDEPAPEHLKKRLKDVDSLDDKARRLLLEDVRIWLGLPGEKTLELAARGIFARLEAGGKAQERSSYVPADKVGPTFRRTDIAFGVGLKLESDPASGFIRVTTPLFDSPAHRAGICAGDIITHIRVQKNIGGNARLETVSTEGMSVERAAELILGPAGVGPVGLVVRRPS